MVYAYFPADPRVRREVESLRGAGHEVDVICLRDDGELSRETVRGVGVVRVPLLARRGGRLRYIFQYVLFFLLSLVQLIRLHRHRAFQAVHVHSLPDFQVFCTLPLKLRSIPVVLDLHEALPEMMVARLRIGFRSLLVRLARLAERLSVRFADQVITVNEAVKGVVAERTGRSDIVVVMNSPDAYALRSGGTVFRCTSSSPVTGIPNTSQRFEASLPRYLSRIPFCFCLGSPKMKSKPTLICRR